MRRVKIDLQDILVVLEAMAENGTKQVIFFEKDGLPSLCDAEEPDNVIMFQTFDSEIENTDGDAIH